MKGQSDDDAVKNVLSLLPFDTSAVGIDLMQSSTFACSEKDRVLLRDVGVFDCFDFVL